MDSNQLERHRQQLYCRVPLIGSWLQNQALRTLAEDGSAEAVRLLEEAVNAAGEESARTAALDSLRDLAREGNVAAQEALCRLVIHHDHPQARQEVFASGYVPHEEKNRALFYFLTEQWTEYETFDFDHRLLRQAYDAADARLRRLIAARARQAGRIEWVDVVAGGKQGRRLGVMTDTEWQSAITLLLRSKRWEDLWRLAMAAPPRWAAQILQKAKRTKWPINDGERSSVEELVRLAERWQADDLGAFMHERAALEGHEHEVRCLAIAPSAKLLASGSADFTVRLWSLPDGRFLKSLERHEGWVNCLAITPNGRLLVSAGRDGVICLWSLPRGELLRRLKGHTQTILCLGITPDGKMLISGSADHSARLWSLPRGKALETLEGHNGSVICLALGPDGRRLATGSADGAIRLWSLPEGRAQGTLDGHFGMELDGVLALAISPNGRILASGGVDGNVQLWKMPGGQPLKKLRGHTGQVGSLQIHPDGDLLVSGGGDNAVQFWRLPSGRLLRTLAGTLSENHSLALSPDGKLLASCSGGGLGGLGFDPTVRLWSVPDGRLVKALSGHSRSVGCLAFSRDSRLLASGSGNGSIRIWSAELARLGNLPAGKATLKDLEWVQETLAKGHVLEMERNLLEFIAAFLRWRRRSDILVDQAAPRVIEVGAFDIEIEA